jgi:hypothetical protein
MREAAVLLERLSLPADGVREGPAEALHRLVTTYALSPFERDVVLLVGLPEEHEAVAALARALHPRAEPWLSPGGLAAVLDLDADGREHLREALTAGPLHQHRLVRRRDTGPWPETALQLPDGLWDVLRGHDHWPRTVQPRQVRPVPDAPATVQDALRALQALQRHPPGVVLVGGGGRRSPAELAAMVQRAADAVALPVVVVDAPTVADPATADLLGVHAAARGAVPVLLGQPAAPPLPGHPGSVVVCVEDTAGTPLDERPVVVCDVAAPDLRENLAMWEALLPELNGQAPVHVATLARTLAGVLRVDAVLAREVVTDTVATARALHRDVTAADVIAQARRRSSGTLPPSGRLVRPTAHWSDLVTTPDNEVLLRSVVDRVRGQVRVLHEWGFAARASRGVRAMLAGPPGTGKTLAAHVVTATLGLDLLTVDLSALVSKWLGETEQHISEIFAAAERTHAVLFFDEADAVFGRRTDGHDAQGRWANLETAHLLARMDAFEGLVVLATNLAGHIDDAFARRLDVVVEFEEPGPAQRLRIWQAHLPAQAPLAADVDVARLAATYPLTGGTIRNTVLAAAFRAAALDGPIDQALLLDAIAQEYRKAGLSFPGAPRPRPTLQQNGAGPW